jgi:hypothetical protein
MLRQNRWSIRISFILVIIAAAFGVWYASTFWQPEIEVVDTEAYTQQFDWVETVSAIGEQAIQVLLGATSGK